MFRSIFEIPLPVLTVLHTKFRPELKVPFSINTKFGVSSENPDLLIHEYNEDILNLTNMAYETDSSSSDLNAGVHHQSLLNNFLTHFTPRISHFKKEDVQILEIGCGEGRIVHYFSEQGYKNISACEAATYPLHKKFRDINFINNYFSVELFGNQKFDLIFSKTVFEHIPQIEQLLTGTRELLSDDGVLFFSVPNCEMELELGDPRMLALGHWNYFTKKNIGTLLTSLGFEVLSYNFGLGDLFVTCKKSKYTLPRSDTETDPLLLEYGKKLYRNIEVLQNRIDTVRKVHGKVAIYGVDMNFPLILDWSDVQMRMIDSDKMKWGMLYNNGMRSGKYGLRGLINF